MKDNPFTKEEQNIMNLIVQAHNEWVKLEPAHPDDARKWADAIHSLQDVLIYRVIKRDYPEHFF